MLKKLALALAMCGMATDAVAGPPIIAWCRSVLSEFSATWRTMGPSLVCGAKVLCGFRASAGEVIDFQRRLERLSRHVIIGKPLKTSGTWLQKVPDILLFFTEEKEYECVDPSEAELLGIPVYASTIVESSMGEEIVLWSVDTDLLGQKIKAIDEEQGTLCGRIRFLSAAFKYWLFGLDCPFAQRGGSCIGRWLALSSIMGTLAYALYSVKRRLALRIQSDQKYWMLHKKGLHRFKRA